MRQIARLAGWGAYQAVTSVALAAAAPWVLWRRGGHYRETILPRLGRYDEASLSGKSGTRRLWIHAVSVGEAGVAATLARSLPVELPLVVTTITPTGQQRARKLFGGGPLGDRSIVTYFPFDLGFAVGRFLRLFEPRALVMVEGDLWPLVLRTVRRRGLPAVVVNGRVSDRSFRRMQRLRRLLGPLFEPVQLFGVQTKEDRRRLVALGVPEETVTVTGNLKYETEEPPCLEELEGILRSVAAGRPMLVAGSTMEGEEEQVLEAFRRLGGGERALLLVAPRHPERWGRVGELLEERGFCAVRRTALRGKREASPDGLSPEVVLLDSLGELASVYRSAAAAFIGGTLVPTGGHNPLEPARFAVPTVVGPSMENFREMAETFDKARAWARAANVEELSGLWQRWLDDPREGAVVGRRAADLIEANRGALRKTLDLLAPVVATVTEDQ